MPRRSPELERLELIITGLQRDLEGRRRDPGDMPVLGCGDNSCQVRQPQGMGTNGGCRCDERDLRRALRWQKRRSAFLEETIREMVADHAGALSQSDARAEAWMVYAEALRLGHPVGAAEARLREMGFAARPTGEA